MQHYPACQVFKEEVKLLCSLENGRRKTQYFSWNFSVGTIPCHYYPSWQVQSITIHRDSWQVNYHFYPSLLDFCEDKFNPLSIMVGFWARCQIAEITAPLFLKSRGLEQKTYFEIFPEAESTFNLQMQNNMKVIENGQWTVLGHHHCLLSRTVFRELDLHGRQISWFRPDHLIYYRSNSQSSWFTPDHVNI